LLGLEEIEKIQLTESKRWYGLKLKSMTSSQVEALQSAIPFEIENLDVVKKYT
jgi:hypothetical protein